MSLVIIPALGGRRVINGGDDLDQTVLHGHLDAKAELAAGLHLQVAEALGIHVARSSARSVCGAIYRTEPTFRLGTLEQGPRYGQIKSPSGEEGTRSLGTLTTPHHDINRD
jgi:hypothetical protein